MSEPKTLTEAREQLEAVNTQLAEFSAKAASYDSLLTQFGIVAVTTDADGLVHYESTVIQEKDAQLADLAAKHAEAIENARLLKIDFGTAVSAAATEKASYEARITKLEASQKTVETRARELVGSLGGPPLAVDSSDAAELTPDILRSQLQAAKEPSAQLEIYKKLKAAEAKAKNKVNGTR